VVAVARNNGVSRRWCAALALAAALAAGTGSDAAANEDGGAVRPTEPAQQNERRMASKPCGASEIERSTCMIELILADLKSSGIGVGGGGITSIKGGAGLSYTVALPKEERTVLLTYEFVASDGGLTIGSRTEATESY